MASDATFHFSNQGLLKQNVESDATFLFLTLGNQGSPKQNVASDATFHLLTLGNQGLPKQNVASDATFHLLTLGNQGLPKRNVASSLPALQLWLERDSPRHLLAGQGSLMPHSLNRLELCKECGALPPLFPGDHGHRGSLAAARWVARTELERVVFPPEKARAEASSEPKSRGPSTPRDATFRGGLQVGNQTKRS